MNQEEEITLRYCADVVLFIVNRLSQEVLSWVVLAVFLAPTQTAQPEFHLIVKEQPCSICRLA